LALARGASGHSSQRADYFSFSGHAPECAVRFHGFRRETTFRCNDALEQPLHRFVIRR